MTVPLTPEQREAVELREELGDGFVDTDRVSTEELERQLELARERAIELGAQLRSGAVRPCPSTCAWNNGGCSYPSVCRVER